MTWGALPWSRCALMLYSCLGVESKGWGGRLGLRRRLASQGMVWSGLVTLSNIRKGKDPLDS